MGRIGGWAKIWAGTRMGRIGGWAKTMERPGKPPFYPPLPLFPCLPEKLSGNATASYAAW